MDQQHNLDMGGNTFNQDVALLGKHNDEEQRRQVFMNNKNALMTECDFAEGLKAESDIEIQSEAFGLNRSLSIEGFSCNYHNQSLNDNGEISPVKMDFHSPFI
eukprot:7431586-Ditylum_brightwellii.AAC.1